MEEPHYWDIAQQHQQKFEFYMVALVFTVLGLSIQTANENVSFFILAMELFAWAFFLISGLSGLSKLEWAPITMFDFHYRDIEISKVNKLHEAKAHGHAYVTISETKNEEPIDERIQKQKILIERYDEKIVEVQKLGKLKYRIHKYAFAVGLILLIVSRGSNLLTPYIHETSC